MSAPSPLTTAFLTEWRRGLQKRPIAIVRVALTDPSPVTFDVGTRPAYAGSLNAQGLLLEHGPINADGSYLSSGPDIASTWFTLPAQARFAWQASSKRVLNAFTDFRWRGAAVTCYLAIENATDTPIMFSGIVDDYEVGRDVIRVNLIQTRTPTQLLAADLVSRAAYPRAPDPVIGAVRPVVYGDCGSQPMRGDWNRENRTAKRQAYDIYGGMIPASKSLIVDPGMGSGTTNPKGKILVASHTLQNVIEDSNLGSMGVRAGDRVALLDVPSGDLINTSTEAGASLDDTAAFGYVVIPMRAMLASANPADTRGVQLGVINEYAFTRLDYDATKRTANYAGSAVEPLGDISDVGIAVGWKTSANVDCLQFIDLFSGSSASAKRFDQAGGVLVGTTTPSAGIALTGSAGTYFNATELASWDFSRAEVRCGFSGVATGRLFDVYFVGMVVKYRPKQRVLKVERRDANIRDFVAAAGGSAAISRVSPTAKYQVEIPTTEVDGEFYAQPRGYKDDGSGTYTGVANALIERAPDIARHLLVTYGGIAGGSIETTGGNHGSFPDARAGLKTWTNEDMRFGRVFEDTRGVIDAIKDLAEQSLSCVYINRFNGKFVFLPWTPGVVARTYDYLIKPNDLTEDLVVEQLSTQELVTAVRVAYLSDAFKGNNVAACQASYIGSQSGYPFLDVRDEYLTVVTGVNDKLDFAVPTTGNVTVTLTAATYTASSLMQHVQTQMRAGVSSVNSRPCCSYGPLIVAGYNDKIDFNDGANKTATIAAAAYANYEALAVAIAAALNAVSANFSCSFNRTTRKLTISKTAVFSLLWLTGASRATSAATPLGYNANQNLALGTSYTAEYEREEDRFCIGNTDGSGGGALGTVDLRWQNGTNGLDGTRLNCGDLLGFLALRDQTGGQSSWMGVSPKGTREQTLSDIRSKYGGRREVSVDANWIRDGYTARELRNRLIALGATSLNVIKLAAHTIPDLERLRVIELSTDFDADYPYPKVGGNGSWAGKLFWAIATRQHMGPARWDTEVVAVEAV